jgi:hypothetical protein
MHQFALAFRNKEAAGLGILCATGYGALSLDRPCRLSEPNDEILSLNHQYGLRHRASSLLISSLVKKAQFDATQRQHGNAAMPWPEPP